MPEPRPQGHLLIGPPGSGKSTLAAILAPLLPAQVISTDALREQLWGDANIQGPWSELEPHLHGAIDRAIAALEALPTVRGSVLRLRVETFGV